MQHQYWVTKKSVLRKLGGKEDECIVSSDAELDAKLELFKSISDSCVQLQRVLDVYQERLCYLAQEENALGRYLKECGRNEKNASAGQIMTTAGKALAYTGHQSLIVRSPLVRLHHEVETFRCRAVSDTRSTVGEMEKVRTEYRAALSWMKSTSNQLDPDTGHGLERFRKAQAYVKTTKVKFDRLTLACLQKVDLLAAARCNMFSHALVPYQSSLCNLASKAAEALTTAAAKVETTTKSINRQLNDGDIAAEKSFVSNEDKSDGAKGSTEEFVNDKDKNTFFNAEYTDDSGNQPTKLNEHNNKNDENNLLGYEFSTDAKDTNKDTADSSNLLDLSWPVTEDTAFTSQQSSNFDFLSNDFMPSKLLQAGELEKILPSISGSPAGLSDGTTNPKNPINPTNTISGSLAGNSSNSSIKPSQNNVSWLSLFADLDPLSANQDNQLSGQDKV